MYKEWGLASLSFPVVATFREWMVWQGQCVSCRKFLQVRELCSLVTAGQLMLCTLCSDPSLASICTQHKQSLHTNWQSHMHQELIIITIIMSVFQECLSMRNMLHCAEQVQIQKQNKTHAYKTLKTAGVKTIMLKHPTKHKKRVPMKPTHHIHVQKNNPNHKN